MTVAFIMYRHGQNDPTRYPHLFTRLEIHGDVVDGWTAPGNGLKSEHYFISLSRVESIEFWDVVDVHTSER